MKSDKENLNMKKSRTIDCIVNKEASAEERGTYVCLFLVANVKQNFGNYMEPEIAR